jgi:hypothetical protein
MVRPRRARPFCRVARSLLGTEWHVTGWQRSLVSSLALSASAVGAILSGRTR